MRTTLTAAAVIAFALAGSAPAAAKDDVPDKRMYAVYVEAGRSFGISPRIIAAIHFIEHGYGAGARKGTYLGPYGFGDNAWSRHKRAYRKGKRPKSYPYQSGRLKRCRDKHPCIHDLFDAAMAAAQFLKDAGGRGEANSRGSRKALCYYNTGVAHKKCDYEKRVLKKVKTYSRKRFRG